MSLNPQFTHDCSECIFLGSFNGEDLYFHPNPPITLISRRSDNGPDYASGLPFWNVDVQLGEAAERTKKLGLLTQQYLDEHRIYIPPYNQITNPEVS